MQAGPLRPRFRARMELLTRSSSSWDTPFSALEVLAGDGALETTGSPAPASAVLRARLARAFSICSCGRGRRSWVAAGRKEKFPLRRPPPPGATLQQPGTPHTPLTHPACGRTAWCPPSPLPAQISSSSPKPAPCTALGPRYPSWAPPLPPSSSSPRQPFPTPTP